MTVEVLIKAAEALQSSGPYFLVIALGYAYWRERGYIKELHRQNLELSKEHIIVTAEMGNAVMNLKDTITDLNNLLQTLIISR